MAQLGVSGNHAGFLLLTNAYYGRINDQSSEQYEERLMKCKFDGAMPCVVALAVNKAGNLCRGMVLGFSRQRVMDYLKGNEADRNPRGGEDNPVFCIARIKGCMQMAKMKPEDHVKWVVELRRFSGDQGLVNRICNADGDPYAPEWGE